ncbi:MAG: DUF488 domain-containing protein, partial [Rickettsiales bacterium]|nr:DUF488 domain-containing protein [Rickettsiales bacterium]
MRKIFTIGFSGKNEGAFMDTISAAGVRRLIDIRLWRASRFVMWAGGTNLAAMLGARYVYVPELTPSKELLADYKDGKIDWPEYEKIFNGLLEARQAEKLPMLADPDGFCFLCTEKSADKCHR